MDHSRGNPPNSLPIIAANLSRFKCCEKVWLDRESRASRMSVFLTAFKGKKVDPPQKKKEFQILFPKEAGMSPVKPYVTNVHHRLNKWAPRILWLICFWIPVLGSVPINKWFSFIFILRSVLKFFFLKRQPLFSSAIGETEQSHPVPSI